MNPRDDFIAMIAALARQPFPERYVAYRRIRPSPYESPPLGRIANDENLALILVMSENFPQFGVKRMGAILEWPNIQIHHVLKRGVAHGHVVKVSTNMYRAVLARELLAKLQSPSTPPV